ncbi:integrase core domain-containing protein [Pseudomonas sp. UBA2684]|uniref:integrase core domain-containing protein n=1 Tax=Pseudomonas sp. UBA2684 TaxID=1947311 RepID=UPI000E7F55D1|nr:integrase core domain-containing protein [Pseudomonas sp. UBA2684]HBX57755.1 integrase [Pseudomonas sp.]|tara:strand:- start:22598 stop:23491 length:894 start_codon:yes stop_codon:yes gene_type:complete
MPQWILQLCRMLLRWLFPSRRPRPSRHGWKRTHPDQPMRQPRKPTWMVDELVRLKALMPQAGCRRVADTFNRRFAAKKQLTVSKSYVAYTLRGRRYEIECLRRKIRQYRPGLGESNKVWGLDLTGKQDVHGQQHPILGLIDHGSRQLLTLTAVPNKSAWTLLGYLFLAIGRFGKPQALRSDNERVFTGRLFSTVLRLAGIRQQLSDPGCPWQNSRIERLFGTLKGKLDRWRLLDRAQLYSALSQFAFWYNAVRPHQNLGGRTPLEAWQGIDPYRRPPRREEWFEAWDGLLQGYHLRF